MRDRRRWLAAALICSALAAGSVAVATANAPVKPKTGPWETVDSTGPRDFEFKVAKDGKKLVVKRFAFTEFSLKCSDGSKDLGFQAIAQEPGVVKNGKFTVESLAGQRSGHSTTKIHAQGKFTDRSHAKGVARLSKNSNGVHCATGRVPWKAHPQ